jgi:hypothetical protein
MSIAEKRQFHTDLNPRLMNRWFVGIVINNNDATRPGFVQIRITDLSRNVTDQNLAWAYPFSADAWNTGTQGSIDVPPIGAQVVCSFQSDDALHPFYLGSAINTKLIISELMTDYPNVYGRIDSSGNLVLINTLRDTVSWVQVTGTSIQIDGHGHVQVNVADHAVGPSPSSLYPAGITFNVIGNVNIQASGNATMSAQGTLDLLGQTVNIGGGSTVNISANNVGISDAAGPSYTNGYVRAALASNTAVIAGTAANGASNAGPGCPALGSVGSVPSPSTPATPSARTRPTTPNVANMVNL